MSDSSEGHIQEFSAPSWLEQEFLRTWPWLEAALDTVPVRTHRKEDIWDGLQRGMLQLWPTPKSACLTQVDSYPTGAKVLTWLLAGGDLSEIKITVPKVEKFAKEAGCHYALLQGRSGWERAVPGYKRVYCVAYREL